MRRLVVLSASLLFLAGCEPEATSRLSSKDYPEREERVAWLQQQIVAPTTFTDAEFELFDVNGFNGQRSTVVPGASSWHYRLAVRTSSDSVDAWSAGMKRVPLIGGAPGWTIELQQIRPANWRTSSAPEAYRDGERSVIVYRGEGIVFKEVIHN